MLIAVLFIIAKTWKQAGCPAVAECVSERGPLQRTEFYSVIKGKDFSCHEKTETSVTHC